MSHLRAVTVYCSSSADVDPIYPAAAESLGRAIAGQDWTLVYGGNYLGLMAAVARGARDAGGRVVGITPQLFLDKGQADTRCDELVVTANMRDRKELLEHRGDAFVALPGGLGTFEEFFEILVGRQLGYHDKPIVVLNLNRYYDPLIAMIDHGIDGRFIKYKSRDLFFVADDVESALEYLKKADGGRTPTWRSADKIS